MMRSRLLVPCLVITMSAAAAAPASAAARVVTVTTPNQLRTALNAVIAGDVIELAPGTYRMSDLSGDDYYFIDSPGVHFTVRSAQPGAATIDGEGNSRLLWLYGDGTPQSGWVTFEDLVFANGNTVDLDAGGVKIRGGMATFKDCVFENNTATPGLTSGASAGAFLITEQAVVQFIRCSFVGNSSDNHGGAMLIGQGAEVFIHDSEFIGNVNNVAGHRANGLGGAIHAYNSAEGVITKLRISDTLFDSNEAGFVGGAIMAKGNFSDTSTPFESPTSVIVSNSTFTDNIALNNPQVTPNSPTEGGAIMAENNVDLEIYNSRFIGNSAGLGGAISGFRADVLIESSVLLDNSAFGRVATDSTGRGGAIKVHSSDSCSDPVNYPTGSLEIRDTTMEGCSAQGGGCIFAAGDTNRRYSAVSGCQMGTLSQNRLPVTLDHVIMAGCTVDDTIGNHAVGGGMYGLLLDLEWTDSIVVDSVASGTDPSDPASSSQGHGGAASIRQESLVTLTGSTFGGNAADHEGGALHFLGCEISSFSDNTFVGNEVSPGGSRPVTQSEGAAMYVSVSTVYSLDMLGSVEDSVFTDNIGLPIFELDANSEHACQCANRVTYDDNAFYNTTYDDDVFRNNLVAGAHTVEELNSLVVDRGSGDTTDKSPLGNNVADVEPITVAEAVAAPVALLTDRASGASPISTESYLGWVWNGGCAELDGGWLDPATEATGTSSMALGAHQLAVWAGGSCSGGEDLLATKTVLQGSDPAGTLTANPASITGGGSSTLSWVLTSGSLLTGLISHGADSEVTSPSGSVQVMPDNTIHYEMGLVAKQGGVVRTASVWVDENPGLIFADGFESGNTLFWSATVD